MVAVRKLVFYAISSLCAAVPCIAQKPVYKSDVRLISLSVQVQDESTGALVDGLGAGDFEVRDNGEEVSIRFFEYGPTPADVLILRDIGGVACARAYKGMSQAIRSALNEFGGRDRIAVVAFASKLRVLCDWTIEKENIGRALFGTDTRVWSRERLLDAIVSAADLMQGIDADEPRSRLLLLLTDGRASNSQAGLGQATAKVLDAGCTVAAVFYSTTRPWNSVGVWFPPGFGKIWERKDPFTQPAVIEPIIRETGGEVITGDSDADVFRGLIRRFRARYLLGYYAPTLHAPSFHRIAIRLKGPAAFSHPNIRISARSGYYSDPK